jgi:hypothetical protein
LIPLNVSLFLFLRSDKTCHGYSQKSEKRDRYFAHFTFWTCKLNSLLGIGMVAMSLEAGPRMIARTILISALLLPLPSVAQEPPVSQQTPAKTIAPVKPAAQMDWGLQWRAQDGAAKNDLTSNSAASIKNSVPGAPPAGTGVSAGFQLKW